MKKFNCKFMVYKKFKKKSKIYEELLLSFWVYNIDS
jgi:hypothetical protein